MIKEKNLQSEPIGVVMFPKRSGIIRRGELYSLQCNRLKHNGTNDNFLYISSLLDLNCKNLC
jgi:hypothetical protein